MHESPELNLTPASVPRYTNTNQAGLKAGVLAKGSTSGRARAPHQDNPGVQGRTCRIDQVINQLKQKLLQNISQANGSNACEGILGINSNAQKNNVKHLGRGEKSMEHGAGPSGVQSAQQLAPHGQ